MKKLFIFTAITVTVFFLSFISTNSFGQDTCACPKKGVEKKHKETPKGNAAQWENNNTADAQQDQKQKQEQKMDVHLDNSGWPVAVGIIGALLVASLIFFLVTQSGKRKRISVKMINAVGNNGGDLTITRKKVRLHMNQPTAATIVLRNGANAGDNQPQQPAS